MLDAGNQLTPVAGARTSAARSRPRSRTRTPRGLVHRDIKPANLLFDEHAIVRVADFGLARALAEASWTEPAGDGRRHHPLRRARAGDGRVPRRAGRPLLARARARRVRHRRRCRSLADTPIGTLTRRGPAADHRAPLELGPLGPVIERAGRPDPDERYPDAATMARRARRRGPAAAAAGPLVLAGVGAAAVDPHPTRLDARAAGSSTRTTATRLRSSRSTDDSTRRVPDRRRAAARRRSGRAVPFVVAAAGRRASSPRVAILLARLGRRGHRSRRPSSSGSTQTAATAAASEAGRARSTLERARRPTIPPGLVIEPGPGARARGSPTAAPSRSSCRAARRRSRSPTSADRPRPTRRRRSRPRASSSTAQRQNDETVAVGLGDRHRAARSARASSPTPRCTLLVSDGPAPVGVPDVHGASFEEAAAQLQGQGFTAARGATSSATPSRRTRSSRTEPGRRDQRADRGSTVTVIVSKGPELVQVPEPPRQRRYEQAQQKLPRTRARWATLQNYLPGGKVRAQDPDPGTDVPKGAKVTLVFIGVTPAPASLRRLFGTQRGRSWVHWTDASPSSPAPGGASGASTRCCSPPRAPRSSSTTSAATSTATGDDRAPAQQVVDEIKAMGGEAVANADNVADWDGGQRLVDAAIETFGDLHVLVNNAGILRDRVLVNMTEEEWDAVIHVHLKGHFVPDPLRRRLLARAVEGRQGGQGVDHQHVVDVGPARQPGPDQLRRGQVRHRDVLADLREGARPLRRALERDRARRPAPASPSRRPGWARSSKAPEDERSSTSGTRPTSRRSSPTSPPRTAPSPARRSSCRAAWSARSSRGR